MAEIRIPQDPFAEFLRALDIDELPADSPSFRANEGDQFVGISQWMPHGRVFGGQVLAQCLVAATRTLQHGRSVHSLHGYFCAPATSNSQ